MNRKGQMCLGIVGYGGMGGWHGRIASEIEGLVVKGVFDIKPERGEAAKEKGFLAYESLEALLGDEEIDIVLVSTPNDLHQAMKAGKNVVSEKPVTLSSADLEEMIRASEENGVLFTVHQNRRWDEDFLTVKKIFDEKLIGEPFRIESRVHGSRGIPGDWRQEPEHGGGMVLDWGVHLLDQVMLMVPEKLKRVYATVTNVTNTLVDDGFTAELMFESGLQVMVEVGTSNFVCLPRWYVLGQDGTAVIEDWSLKGKIVRAVGVNEKDITPVITAAGLTKTMAPRREDTIRTEELPIVRSDIHDFYKNVMAAIRGEEEPKIKLPEVMRVMKLMEAVFESAKNGQAVVFEKGL